ncbi:phage N-6-adenine-methyltransferase [Nocardioides bruguierae]|uniref:Phage N-6-adenine-methyltransferase n=1 Tax=Nocardioides bruguierae TaxID=2945102 RepID=A0A9X2DB06_9ACTN|nr:phage N-6-adenine-methyltransferase [Nocardioides bruguierae]MCM0622602.1 phage N-6-adenine-methyltransferase [Nocardioides bruguierae]
MLAGFKAENHPQQTAVRGALDSIDDRGTKWEFIHELEARFGAPFTLDVAAAPHNAKAPRFFSIADDGLAQDWSGRVWCNPPFSRVPGVTDLGSWVRKAWDSWQECERIVMLVPANRVEQAWWQDHVEPFRDRADSPLRVEFLRGRMRFDHPEGWDCPTKGDRPPFGIALLIWETSSVRPEDGRA